MARDTPGRDAYQAKKKRVIGVRGTMGPPVPKPKPEPHDGHMPPSVQATLHPSTSKAAALKQVQAEKERSRFVPTLNKPFIAEGQNTQFARPAFTPTKTVRFEPHFEHEPVAGYQGMLRNPDGTWAPPGTRPQPGAYVSDRPYYTDANTAAKHRGPAADEGRMLLGEDTFRNAQKAAPVASPLLRGVVDAVATALPGVPTARQYARGEHVTGSTVLGDVANTALNLVPAGKAAAVIGVGFKGAKLAKDAEQVTLDARIAALEAKAAQTPRGAVHQAAVSKAQHDLQVVKAIRDAHGDTPESRKLAAGLIEPTAQEQLKAGLKGVPSLSGKQKVLRSEEAARRSKEVDRIQRSGLPPDEIATQVAAAMRGEMPKIEFNGLRDFTPETLSELRTQVNQHDTLLPFQKTRLDKALVAAHEGKMPTPSEMRLIEHVFGKGTAASLSKTGTGLGDKALNVLNVPRSLMATADLSAPLRQGLVAGATHPVIWGKSWRTMFESLKSESNFQAAMQEIESDPLYNLALAAKVSFTDVGAGVTAAAHEEQFASELATKIPGFGHVVKGSARAYTGFLNKLRMDLFKYQIETAQRAGHDVNNEKWLNDIGRVVNAATGRGSLPASADNILPAANALFFSPRLILSRINYLDPTWYVRLGRGMEPWQARQVRIEALKGLFATAGAVTGAVYLLSLIPGVDVVTDPRSADFGKAKMGNTRVDLSGGFQPYVRLAAQLKAGASVSTTTGQVTKFGSGFGQPNRLDVSLDFLFNKFNPPAGIVVNTLRGTDAVGKPAGLTSTEGAVNTLKSSFVPMIWHDAKDIYNEKHGGLDGIAFAAGGYVLGGVGTGLQTYGPKDVAKKPTDKLTQRAKAVGMPPPDAALIEDVKHKANLDALSHRHPNDPQGKLDAYIKYYAEATGDHQWDRIIGQNLPDDEAISAADTLRHTLVSGLYGYEQEIRDREAARGIK